MRTMEFRTSKGVRVAVSKDDGSLPMDVTEGLAGYGLADLNQAISHARNGNVSLTRFLGALADASETAADVDMHHGTHTGPGGVDHGLPPIQPPEVWGAGVTYRRSAEAREAESLTDNDFYSMVYAADRPEIFLKDSAGRRTVGPDGDLGIRRDSRSSIPEPELGLVLDSTGRVVGFTLGNDVTARDIESENPLYLPQAKIFTNSCAIGPCVLLCEADPDEVPPFPIELSIHSSEGVVLYQESTSTTELTRRYADLVAYLTRDNPIADGTILLTGTGLVPPPDFALRPGDVVTITSGPIGSLRNTVSDLARTPRDLQVATQSSQTGIENLG